MTIRTAPVISFDHHEPSFAQDLYEFYASVRETPIFWSALYGGFWAAALDAGSIGVNGAGAPAGPGAPFGGVKQRAYVREGGRAGLAGSQRDKNVLIGLGQ
jgi:hypothetical protein